MVNGQGRVLGGIITAERFNAMKFICFYRNSGPALSPFITWVLGKNLETLDVRIHRHCENAIKVAKTFESS